MNNMEIHVGDIVKVIKGPGNGIPEDGIIGEIMDYAIYGNFNKTSGLLDGKDRFVVKFEYGGYTQYRSVTKNHIIEIIQSVIKYTTEDYNYLIPLLTELNTT